MAKQGLYGQALGEHFRLDNAPAVVTKSIKRGEIGATHLIQRRSDGLPTVPIPREDAFLVNVLQADCHDHELWFDGKSVKTETFPQGHTVVYDLRSDPIALMRHPVSCIMFYLPRRALKAIADENGADLNDLGMSLGTSVDDHVVRALGAALRPAFERPEEASRLFLDHTMSAMATHFAFAYGGLKVRPIRHKGGLSDRNIRHTKELMDANLDGDIPLSVMAAECGLSTRHFTRAFRQSVGLTPHHWLLNRRTELARELLKNTSRSLSEVAIACGFADQSHFTRVFTTLVGVSPGYWRRMNI